MSNPFPGYRCPICGQFTTRDQFATHSNILSEHRSNTGLVCYGSLHEITCEIVSDTKRTLRLLLLTKGNQSRVRLGLIAR